MSNLTAPEKTTIRAAARAFLDRPNVADLRLALHDELMTVGGFRDAAWHEPAERFVAMQETWAREIGALFAETVRLSFRATARAVLSEKAAAVHFEDEARQAAREASA
jgi:hypothetical protein